MNERKVGQIIYKHMGGRKRKKVEVLLARERIQ